MQRNDKRMLPRTKSVQLFKGLFLFMFSPLVWNNCAWVSWLADNADQDEAKGALGLHGHKNNSRFISGNYSL
jgi:hypothetical protein